MKRWRSRATRPTLISTLALAIASLALAPASAAQPSVKQAFGLVPMQPDVEFDKPDQKQIEDYRVEPENGGGVRAWVVKAPDGTMMRRFSDTNSDNKIDQWCYFRNGVEVYRDIDGNYNEKADQYRWFGTGGLRWGLDQDEDGRIDNWKWISPEEVSAETVRSIRDKDVNRFVALLIRPDEIKQLGLSGKLSKKLTQQTQRARDEFKKFATDTKQITSESAWVDFSAPQPGVIPAGGEYGEQDLIVYEHVLAMYETKGTHGQLPVGTLIRVGDRWRLIDLPNESNTGFFFRSVSPDTLPVASVSNQANEAIQKLVEELEKLDKKLSQAGPQSSDRVHEQRSDLLRQLARESKGEARDMWLSQLVDSVVSVSHDGAGAEVLKKLVKEISAATKNKEVIGQATFSYMTADYSASLQEPNAKLGKVQDKWIDDLEEFAKSFQGTRPAGEAMLQLAISEEFAGEDKSAIEWYSKIIGDFADTDLAAKARGAADRLQSVGKPLSLRGPGLTGSPLDLAKMKGNLVAVQYWATWCEPCKQDMEELKKLQQKYGKKKFAVVGVNLDDSASDAQRYVKQARVNWPQFHDEGGLQSDLAKQMGIFTLPVMLLVDETGKVVNRQITVAELASELQQRRGKRR